MEQHTIQKCEKCCRDVATDQIVKIDFEHHIGYICSMCHYILIQQQDQEGFKAMIREKTYEQSNTEMQEVHRILSVLITVGIAFCIVIIGALTIKILPIVPTIDALYTYVEQQWNTFNQIIPIRIN